jgi:hypothetical protein
MAKCSGNPRSHGLSHPRMVKKSQGKNASRFGSRVTQRSVSKKFQRPSYATPGGSGSTFKILPVRFAPGMPLARRMRPERFRLACGMPFA